jgi:hypothetical protein
MRMVMDIVTEFDPEVIVGTDGSPEGILTGVSMRPQKVSIFYRDEISGLFDSFNRKEYMANMRETLTQLYDVPKLLRRPLRKETIFVQEPYFIFFGGGVRDIVYSIVDDSYITSGFLPRFLVVCGENDPSKMRGTGPPTETTIAHRQKVYDSLIELKEQYSVQSVITVGGEVITTPMRFEAKLTSKAWEHYQAMESLMYEEAAKYEPIKNITNPIFNRLTLSVLKMSLLVAATRRSLNDNNELEVTKDDVHQAAWYVQKWGVHSIDLLENAGKTDIEKQLDKIKQFVQMRPGCTKSLIMNTFRLSARDAREVLDTLIERGIITGAKAGRGWRFYPTI